jgi:L-galactose dehydrogenase
MQTIEFGKTGATVSVVGLGCGGHSRLGQTNGASAEASADVVRAALDLGITFVDTAPAYGTEEIVGQGLAGRRESIVLSTKTQIVKPGASVLGTDFKDPQSLVADVEHSLRCLKTDYIDVYQLHGVMLRQYEHCRENLVPVLQRLRDDGKIRYLGLTERFIYDPPHEMLTRALDDDCWDVVMTGFNLINPSARSRVFARCQQSGVATLVMFAVRRALSNPDALKELVVQMIDAGVIEDGVLDRADPLGFILDEGDATSLVEAAYRFCRHEPGANVVLTGTGSIDHLKDNIASIQGGVLPPQNLERLAAIFGAVDSVSGN